MSYSIMYLKISVWEALSVDFEQYYFFEVLKGQFHACWITSDSFQASGGIAIDWARQTL